MAWSDVITSDAFSVGIGPQTTLDTPSVALVWVDADMPQVTGQLSVSERQGSSAAYGARTPQRAGASRPTIALRWPAAGQPVGYDPATMQPGLVAADLIIGQLMGAGITTARGSCEYTAATAATCTPLPAPGVLIACDPSSSAVSTSWSYASTAPSSVTLLYAVGALATGDLLPSTAYRLAPNSPNGLTIQVNGASAATARRYVGCVPTDLGLELDDSGVAYWTATLTCYGGDSYVAGGLQPIARRIQLPAAIDGGARFDLASSPALSEPSAPGTFSRGACGLSAFSLSISAAHYVVPCPSALEGAEAVVLLSPEVTASVTVPDIPEWRPLGVPVWVNSARAGSTFSAALRIGTAPGGILAILMPAAHVTGAPAPSDVNGVQSFALELRAGSLGTPAELAAPLILAVA